ncbi:hypothetical protein D3C78_1758090 [compost metagenome]
MSTGAMAAERMSTAYGLAIMEGFASQPDDALVDTGFTRTYPDSTTGKDRHPHENSRALSA